MQTIFETIKAFFAAVWDWIVGFFGFLIESLQWVFKWAISTVLEALIALLSAIPVPEWLTSVGGLMGAVPSSVLWGAQFVQLPYGLSVMGSALLLRFMIRRLPIVG